MNQDEQIIKAARRWRETEREMIADKANQEKGRQHHFAKRKLRDAVDQLLKGKNDD